MRRGYDASYGSREQLKDSSERNMKLARELDALKATNAELQDVITELKAIISYMTQGE